jgi:O-acetylhomoserine (thiol)-lyase
VEWVSYPGLPSHPQHANAVRYLESGFGGVLTFGVKGGHAAAQAVIDRVQLFSLLANVGDAKSLIIHPASTTHEQLTPEQQRATGTLPELVRLSVGLEDVRDLIEDLDQALGEREITSPKRELAAAAAR